MTLATRLFVGNLPDNFNEHALKEMFSSYGEITNFDLKCKPGVENENKKKFAFVTLSATNFNVESCIKYFSTEDFHGNKLYVTRARESFLERLQREREQSQNKNTAKNEEEHFPYSNKQNSAGDKHITHKRKFNNDNEVNVNNNIKKSKIKASHETVHHAPFFNSENNDKQFNDKKNKHNGRPADTQQVDSFQNDEKKQNSDKKRMESMKKKRQEFIEKKKIIKTGLVSIDKQLNKRVVFPDTEEDKIVQEGSTPKGATDSQKNSKTPLFDVGGSDDEINFNVKEQYEGKKGQKVLDLQSRYKSDKRFVLDERFIEDSGSEKEEENQIDQEAVDLNQADEKSKQLTILEDVLGVTIKTKVTDTTNKTKTKLGMLRYDPTQPEHAKYLVPVATQESSKKSKKKKANDKDVESEPIVEKVEVSKEQFYKISDSLKDSMTQPTTFSLRSLFKPEDNEQGTIEEDVNFIPLQTKKDTKVKNPLDPGEKNPFVYDSSESENEEDSHNDKIAITESSENKTVWREKLFFATTDHRLKDGLIFFGKQIENEGQKERRELKSLMKKRIYNKERKNTMFQKKIGGRKKTIRKKFRKN